MASPNFNDVRQEISALFDRLVPSQVAENLSYAPLMLQGQSPVVSVEDAGFRSLLASMNPGSFDLAYRVMVRVNRQAHGAEDAAERYDIIRRQIIDIVTDPRLPFAHFEALEIPNGQNGDTFFELIDGVQYLSGFVPVVALNVVCS